MTNYLSNLSSAGATSLVEAIGGAIDENMTSDEERKAFENELARAALQHETEMADIALRENLGYLADVDSARKYQSRVQTSDQAGWLTKNVHSLLAIGILALTFFMYWYIVFGDGSCSLLQDGSGMKDVVIYILGALTTVATQVVSYFFGSSSGSADKSRKLNSLVRKE